MNIVFNYLNFKGLSFFQLCYLSLLSQCHSLLLCMSTFPSICISLSPSGSHFLVFASLPSLCVIRSIVYVTFYPIYASIYPFLGHFLSIAMALSIPFYAALYPFTASFYRFLSLFLSHSMPLSIPVYVRVSPFVYAMISPLICLPSFYPFNFTLFVHVAFYHFSCIFLCPSCPSFTCLSDFVSLSLPFCTLFLLQLTLHFRYYVSLNAYWSLPRYVYVYLS